jgi:uncharacterized protein (TIGR00297 family)
VDKNLLIIAIILTVGAVLSSVAKKLTPAAAVTGWIVGLVIFLGAGYGGVTLLAAFFVAGTLSTSVGLQSKESLGIAEKRHGSRTAGQVIANGGVAALCSACLLLWPKEAVMLHVALAGSLAAASADTVSSELGNVFGIKYYNIITFKKDIKGLDGVISLEGTLAGVGASALIAMIYYLFSGGMNEAAIILLAGIVGNVADSVLGATLERKRQLENNMVNFLNTLTGAIVAGVVFYAIS